MAELPTVLLMQPTLVPTPFHRPGWVYEEKVDGYRMVDYKQRGSAQLISRQGKEFAQRFPELAKAVAGLGAESVVLDSELAVFDRQLISRFEWLRGQPRDDVATPPMLMAFDLLELDDKDQRKRPLRERRQALEHLLTGERLILPVRRLSPPAWRRGRTCCELVMKGWWQGSGVALPGWPVTQVAQSESAEVSRGGASLLQALAVGRLRSGP